MRQDQFDRLIELEEKITEELIIAADPDNWEGAGLKPNQMTKETRGNRHWCVKGAAGMLALGMRLNGLIGQVREASANPGAPDAGVGVSDDDVDAEIDSAEKEAKRLINRAIGSSTHKEFIKRAVAGGK